MAKSEKKKVPDDRTVGPGHNSLSDDDQRALLCQALEQVQKKKDEIASLTADLRNLYKKAKADGIPKAEIDYALYLRKASDDEPKADISMRLRVARWLAHPLGTQASLFDDPDRTPDADKAYEIGKTHGMAGKDGGLNPYHPGSDQGQAWMRGHADAQGSLLGKIKRLDVEEGNGSVAEPPKADEPPVFSRGRNRLKVVGSKVAVSEDIDEEVF